MVISNKSLGYLSGTTSNIQGQIGAVSDNTTLAFSKISRMQTSVDILNEIVTALVDRTVYQSSGNGKTFFQNTVSVQGNLTQISTGFDCGYCVVPKCSDSVTYNFGTDYGVYMVSFTVNKDRIWTLSSYVHVLRSVNGGSFIIPLFQGSNNMDQSIDTGTNINSINCANRGVSLKLLKICTY